MMSGWQGSFNHLFLSQFIVQREVNQASCNQPPLSAHYMIHLAPQQKLNLPLYFQRIMSLTMRIVFNMQYSPSGFPPSAFGYCISDVVPFLRPWIRQSAILQWVTNSVHFPRCTSPSYNLISPSRLLQKLSKTKTPVGEYLHFGLLYHSIVN